MPSVTPPVQHTPAQASEAHPEGAVCAGPPAGTDPAAAPTRAGLREAVPNATYARGAAYAQRGNVVHSSWEPGTAKLHGRVRGSGGEQYSTTARFDDDAGSLRYVGGTCSCPVRFDCKHAVALVLAATGDPAGERTAAGILEGIAATARQAGAVTVGTGTSTRRASASGAAASPSRRRATGPTWTRELGKLLAPAGDENLNPVGGHGRELAGGTPLAVELGLEAGTRTRNAAPFRLTARLVRAGKTGWVGAVPWDQLTSWHVTEFVPAHVQLLRELHALYRARLSEHGYGRVEDGRRLDLSAFDSHRLWALLDEAATIGVRLVHARARLGDLPRYRDGELVVDVTGETPPDADGQTAPGAATGLRVAPVLRVEAELARDAVPLVFLGADGHGVVYARQADLAAGDDPRDWRLRLARLADPVPAPLRRLALARDAIEVPADGAQRLRAEFVHRLRRLATVVSSDAALDLPTATPELVLRASYGAEHALELDWLWAYEVDGAQVQIPLAAEGTAAEPWRDPRAERRALAALDLPPAAAELLTAAQHTAPPGAGHPAGGLPAQRQPELPAPSARFRGAETMRLSTGLLPELARRGGVRVEVDGPAPDYREVGDSLRIAVSTDEVAGENDWFDLGVSVTVADQDVPLRDLLTALSQGDEYLLLPDGAYFSLGRPELAELRRLVEEARALADLPGRGLRISRFQAGLWAELAALGVVDRQAQAWRRQVGGLLALTGPAADVPVPAALRATLRPYQLDGFRWLTFRWRHRLGGVLADDMGLGKTLQTLALICHARETSPETGMAPFLVVAPTSVVANWAVEARRFAPDLRVATIVDTEKRRGRPLRAAVEGADLVVTSYTLFRLESDEYAALPWSALVLDEAQTVKNHQSKAYRCARLLPAPCTFAITGTPLENNLMELWALLSLTSPGLFPSPTRFQELYARPIERHRDPALLDQLRRRVRPLLLRRTKEQAAPELPPKQEQVLQVELHPRHRKLYQTHLQRERQKVLGLVDDLGRNQFTILRSLTLLRQLSLHAGLVDDTLDDLPSAKIDLLLEQLADVVAGGHRALVFSQFTGFLGKVRDRLATTGIAHCYLDGKTRDRADVLEQFRTGTAEVFLISLKAGGFGLNLTEADYCFLLDPWWNPATEAQAVDRAHRIGQTRTVLVYRLVAKDTIEEKVMALKARKAALFTSVLDDGDAFGSALTADDVRELFA